MAKVETATLYKGDRKVIVNATDSEMFKADGWKAEKSKAAEAAAGEAPDANKKGKG